MDWTSWKDTDAAIRAEFGYTVADDLAAARELQALLPPTATLWREVSARIRNRNNLLVVGCGPSLTSIPPEAFVGHIAIACDGATGRLRELGVVPDVVVTDLDGEPEALEWAAKAGAHMVVHAHGDNRPQLASLVARLGPLCFGTHQVEPTPELAPLRNVGGFTDGDRAVLMAESMGAKAAHLVGFDFDAPPSAYSHRWDPRTKPAKLAWAKRIVEACHARGALQLRHWRP